MQASLFETQESRNLLPHDGEAIYFPSFFTSETASGLFGRLRAEISWNQEHVQFYGKSHPMPRLTAWYGDAGVNYTYSKVKNEPVPWSPLLSEIRDAIERSTSARFNSVLLNLYRDNRDSIAWHADDEPELGDQPTIASVSLGGERVFELRHVADPTLIVKVTLENGSLLVMRGATQAFWKHRIAKTTRPTQPRINLTYRCTDPNEGNPNVSPH